MKKNISLVILASLCLLINACNESAPAKVKNYDEKDINIYRERNVVDKTISLRFYNSTPNVPYISVKDYFNEFFNTKLNVKNKDGYHYFLKANNNSNYLGFDATNDIFISNGLSTFNAHPNSKSATGKSFLSFYGYNKTPSSTGIVDLKNYEIDIHDDGDDTYVPLSFLSKIAGGFSGINIAYNGKNIYVLDNHGLLNDEVRDITYFTRKESEGSDVNDYYELLDDKNNKRPIDLAKYNYGELCFTFDNLRGYTSQLNFGDNNLLSLGLNGLIEKYYPNLKGLLLSSNMIDYYQGLEVLFSGLNDGGHTALLDNCKTHDEALDGLTNNPEYGDLIKEASGTVLNKMGVRASFINSKVTAFSLDSSTYPNSPGYYVFDKATETAFLGFDSFNIDYDGWNQYYKNETAEAPVETDTFAFMLSKFVQAKKDNAKNLVIDLTSNGGGNSGALLGVVALLNEGKANFETNNTFNKFRETEYSYVDINLDGKFNGEDIAAAKEFKFNVGVLTSGYSFSCGNLLPSVLKELGYKIIGEQSGGGSCAISIETTADGLMYVRSSYICLSDSSGHNIDDGVEVDLAIEKKPISQFLYDCSDYFNFEILANYLNNAYNQE